MRPVPPIEPFLLRHRELERQMADPAFYADRKRSAELARERRHLEELLAAHRRWENLRRVEEEARSLCESPGTDGELRALARGELAAMESDRELAQLRLLECMLPEDPDDSRNTILEIRAGTGGDEAALFAGDLWRMYARFGELRGWSAEVLGSHPAPYGGFREIAFALSGENVFRLLRYESGVHRVQRIPETEASGRIHTSTATVAVLPEAAEVEVQIAPEELEITVCKASGPGGQGVNTTDSAVQILHRPTGMIVFCADERSQQKNRNKALKVLRARLLEHRQREEQEKYASTRRRQIGSGDRSERIRTYNFPQSRLTDHRIGLTLHNLPQIMEGNLEPVLEALRRADLDVRIASLRPPD
ncbi:MAG: peptide chain release factor 1 [Puniceicoccales bacterium]|jgi:peptide chain release factor 1|nr:peptide chain release factor 1 [Puniceicoccales bacterium]